MEDRIEKYEFKTTNIRATDFTNDEVDTIYHLLNDNVVMNVYFECFLYDCFTIYDKVIIYNEQKIKITLKQYIESLIDIKNRDSFLYGNDGINCQEIKDRIKGGEMSEYNIILLDSLFYSYINGYKIENNWSNDENLCDITKDEHYLFMKFLLTSSSLNVYNKGMRLDEDVIMKMSLKYFEIFQDYIDLQNQNSRISSLGKKDNFKMPRNYMNEFIEYDSILDDFYESSNKYSINVEYNYDNMNINIPSPREYVPQSPLQFLKGGHISPVFYDLSNIEEDDFEDETKNESPRCVSIQCAPSPRCVPSPSMLYIHNGFQQITSKCEPILTEEEIMIQRYIDKYMDDIINYFMIFFMNNPILEKKINRLLEIKQIYKMNSYRYINSDIKTILYNESFKELNLN